MATMAEVASTTTTTDSNKTEFGDDTLMVLQTVQSSAIRNLFETLKDVLCDTNIVFDNTGMKILTRDNNHCVLVSVKLQASAFEVFHCKQRMLVGPVESGLRADEVCVLRLTLGSVLRRPRRRLSLSTLHRRAVLSLPTSIL